MHAGAFPGGTKRLSLAPGEPTKAKFIHFSMSCLLSGFD